MLGIIASSSCHVVLAGALAHSAVQDTQGNVRIPTASTFGSTLEAVGDVNSDGTEDLVAGRPHFPGAQPGAIFALSGADGSVLWSRIASDAEDGFGSILSRGADFDGDGVPDLLAGAPRSGGEAASRGHVLALSGKSGATLHDWAAPPGLADFGLCVGSLSDQDGDGIEDVLVAAEREAAASPGAGAGVVIAFSARRRTLLWQCDLACAGSGEGIRFFGQLHQPGALTTVFGFPWRGEERNGLLIPAAIGPGTGVEGWRLVGPSGWAGLGNEGVVLHWKSAGKEGDLVVSACSQFDQSRLFAVDAGDGSVRQTRDFGKAGETYFHQLSLARTPDLDKDGFEDFVVGWPDPYGTRGEGLLLSGRDWVRVNSYTGDRMEFLGVAVCSMNAPGVKGETIVAMGSGLVLNEPVAAGCVVAFEAKRGRRLWKRADPIDR